MNSFTWKKSLFQFIAVLLIVVITSLFFLLPSERQIAKSYNDNILKNNVNLSFQVPSPGKDQVKELETHSAIDKVFPYYDLFANLKLKNRTLSNYYTMLITNTQTASFPFTQDSVAVKKINYSNNDTVAFIGYSFANDNNLNAGDSIVLNIGENATAAIIGAVVVDPGLFMHIRQGNGSGGAVIVSVPEGYLDEVTKGRTIQYGGAYIRVNDYDGTKNILREYKPMGRLRDRNLFSTQDEYQNYLDNFNKTSYAAEIRDLGSELGRPASFPVYGVLLTLIIAVIGIMLIVTVIFGSKSSLGINREKIKKGEYVNSIIAPIKRNYLVILLFNIVLYLLFFCIFVMTNRTYCPVVNYALLIVPFFIFLILLSALCMGTFIKFYKKQLNIIL
jgi:hypothetical protein